MSARPWLAALADRLGVVPVFHDLSGRERRTSDATREALVAAMGHDGATEEAARRSLEELRRQEHEELCAPVQVWREHAGARPALRLRPREPAACRIALREEGGAVHQRELRLSTGGRTVGVRLPAAPPPGYHRVEVELEGGRRAEQRLIVAPRTAPTARELLGDRRAFGVAANLYSVRGERSWGFGDLGDLEQLVSACGRWGGDFVALNPLHALRHRGDAISPYSPLSRQWRDTLYVEIERVPELAGCTKARERLAELERSEALRSLRGAELIDHEAVLELKLGVLIELHRAFAERERGRPTARGRAHASFLEQGGQALRDLATFQALAEHLGPEHGLDWRRWPAAFRNARSAAVEAFRRDHMEDVDLFAWIQFELDRQLGAAADRGRSAGLGIGIVGDLAVGSPPDSADAWARPELFALGAALGAPPDAFAATGQDWGLVPLDPHRLRADGFRAWTELLRAAFRHAGGLRVDHAIGLVRAFWIPAGRSGSDGAYVGQPTDELLGILALEARRAGALAIGEDLGNVPAGLVRTLASWGVLSTSVLLFERDGEWFRPPWRYSPRALVAGTTHDLVPLAGFVAGRDLELRHALGTLEESDLERARESRRREVAGLACALREAGAAGSGPDAQAVTPAAVHRFLARTPSPLLALSLDDLAGEREPVNLPGVPIERHRSWSRRMSRPLHEIELDAATVGERRREAGAGRVAERAHDGAP